MRVLIASVPGHCILVTFITSIELNVSYIGYNADVDLCLDNYTFKNKHLEGLVSATIREC